MNVNEYLAYVVNNKLIHKFKWVTSIIGLHENNFKNEYIKIENNRGYVKVEEEYVELDTFKNNNFISIDTEVVASPDIFKSLDKEIKTIFGRWIVNYILLEFPFKGKLDYQEEVSLNNILKLVKNKFSNEEITVSEYKTFVTACTYLENFNKLVTPSSTEKLMIPPPGLDKFKKELKQKMVTKYGNDWESNPTRVVEYDNELKKFYNDFIKDDPSDGIIANKKNKGNALAKKYLTFSSTNAFGEQEHVDESLMDGYPKDPVKLAAMFNTSRSASYSRGAETQKGGAVAKSVLRSTSSVVIKDTDCKVEYGKETLVTEDNKEKLVGRYIIINKKSELITEELINKYMGKYIEVRSPLYCKNPSPHYCKICIGDKAGNHSNGISLIVTNISSVLTTAALKAMHNSQISTVKISMSDMIK